MTGAALGAITAIAFGIRFPFLPFAGTMVMAILFAFLPLLVILGLAYKLDYSLSTNTIILAGGSGCGKSAYAEALCARLPKPRFYIAAMRPFGEESIQRIARHRNLRKDKRRAGTRSGHHIRTRAVIYAAAYLILFPALWALLCAAGCVSCWPGKRIQ